MNLTVPMNSVEVGGMSAERVGHFRLTGLERRIVEACTEILLPAGGAIEMSGEQAGVVEMFERVVGEVPPKTRLLLRALLGLIEFSAPVAGVLGGRFSKMSLKKREIVLRRLMNHPVYLMRTAFLGLRTMLTLCYFSDQRVNEQLGCVPDLDPFHLGEVSS